MSDINYSRDEIVTVDFGNLVSSNTYLVSEDLGDDCLLYHPLYTKILLRYPKTKINTVPAKLKDSTEKNLDFAMRCKAELGHKAIAELEALCLYFVVNRKLADNQKYSLARINGLLASIRFNNNIDLAMRYIVQNNGAFDEFNRMWYNNFSGIFNGRQTVTSKKQRSAIFNLAGFLLAELSNPVTEKTRRTHGT